MLYSSLRYCTLGPSHLDEVLALEAEVLSELERPDLLRRNTVDMWRACLLPPHTALGVRVGEKLVALAVLYLPQPCDEEDLATKLLDVETEEIKSANYKICMVLPNYRGHGLQRLLGERLEKIAFHQGVTLLCSTVSPHNGASITSLLRLGYLYNRTLTKYDFERNLYYKIISTGDSANE